jgi:hypothetical protein
MGNDNLSVDKHLVQTMDNQKSVLTSMFDANFDKHETTLSIIVDGLKHANKSNFSVVSSIYNISGFVNLISYDLKIISRDLSFSTKEWQKKLYARQAYLTIYESMDDILELCGNKLRIAIKDFHDFDDLILQINNATSSLKLFNRKHESALKEIRNLVIAHRDHNTLKQLDYITTINWTASITLISEYDSIISEIASLCQVLMTRSVDEVHREYGKA